jgi:hypothetical protein
LVLMAFVLHLLLLSLSLLRISFYLHGPLLHVESIRI